MGQGFPAKEIKPKKGQAEKNDGGPLAHPRQQNVGREDRPQNATENVERIGPARHRRLAGGVCVNQAGGQITQNGAKRTDAGQYNDRAGGIF